VYSRCHQIVCDSDLRIANYSSRWRLMITSEWPVINGDSEVIQLGIVRISLGEVLL